MFSHDGSRRVPAKKGKTEHCRCVAKLPWQKEFQRFVPLSKAGKRSTTWQHFFLFFLSEQFAYFLFLCVFLLQHNVLQEKCFSSEEKHRNEKKEKQDWIDQTNIRAASAKWLLEYSQKESTKTRTYWREEEKKSKDTSFGGKEKHVTHRRWGTRAKPGV